MLRNKGEGRNAPLPARGLARQTPVDQARDGPHPPGVMTPMVPIGLAERLVAAQPPNRVLDGDTPAGEGSRHAAK